MPISVCTTTAVDGEDGFWRETISMAISDEEDDVAAAADDLETLICERDAAEGVRRLPAPAPDDISMLSAGRTRPGSAGDCL